LRVGVAQARGGVVCGASAEKGTKRTTMQYATIPIPLRTRSERGAIMPRQQRTVRPAVPQMVVYYGVPDDEPEGFAHVTSSSAGMKARYTLR